MNLHKMIRSAMLGVAVGDALGVPVEFYDRAVRKQDPVTGMRGGGFHGQKPGTWSDDTSMTLALMDSLTRRGFDIEDQMRCYVDWLWSGKYTAYDEVFDVGGTCKSAIFRYCKGTPAENCGEDGELYCGNGSLMRIMPMALYLYGTGRGELNDETALLIHASSAVTHAHPRCLMACGIYCAVVFRLCAGEEIRPSRIFDLLRRRWGVLDCRFFGCRFQPTPESELTRVLTPPIHTKQIDRHWAGLFAWCARLDHEIAVTQ
jgi:ADP-ribosylglycohydrolase